MSFNLLLTLAILGIVWASRCGAQSISDEFEEIQHPPDEESAGSEGNGVDASVPEATGEVSPALPESPEIFSTFHGSPPLPIHMIKQEMGRFDDPAVCDRTAVTHVVDYEDRKNVPRKTFTNCTLTRGELATITNFVLLRDFLDINCTAGTQSIETLDLPYGKTWVIDSYANPNLEADPGWMCTIKRYSTGDKMIFSPFGSYDRKETFDYEVRSNGLYDMNPHLTLRWTHPFVMP